MSYQALYRKYRPQTFDTVIGEEHITLALKNRVMSNKISHAYLFTGPRGIGKTSCAKILAKAVNCLSPVNGSPCHSCKVCNEISDSFDIIEIDAASNNRVDEIRDIREKVKYMPAVGRYKVYIIDEVHMLTDNAYNALLKTLEEPPSHVIFILATTEAHKLPKTILSRCLRFDFRLVSEDELFNLVKRIYVEIGKDAEDEAIRQIAASGEGCVRDTLSTADICAGGTTGRLTYADVLRLTGASDKKTLIKLVSAAIRGDLEFVFTEIRQQTAAGVNFSVLSRDLISTARELVVVKTCEGYDKILPLPIEVLKELKREADRCDLDTMVLLLENLAHADGGLRYAASPSALIESAVIKTVRGAKTMLALEKKVEGLERIITKGDVRLNAQTVWGEVVAKLKSRDTSLFALCSSLKGSSIIDGVLTVCADESTIAVLKESQAVINRVLADLGYKLTIAAISQMDDTTGEELEAIKQKAPTKLIIKD